MRAIKDEKIKNSSESHALAVGSVKVCQGSVNCMMRIFNTTGPCNPEMHYMVNIYKKLTQIKQLIDTGTYFTINKARQYGKTTTIKALTQYLSKDYIVLSLDFQALGNTEFQTEEKFSAAFAEECVELIRNTEAAVDSLATKPVKSSFVA